MALKQSSGLYAPDGSKYATVTNGAGTLVPLTLGTGASKQSQGSQAPDGSIYFTITDGEGNLT